MGIDSMDSALLFANFEFRPDSAVVFASGRTVREKLVSRPTALDFSELRPIRRSRRTVHDFLQASGNDRFFGPFSEGTRALRI